MNKQQKMSAKAEAILSYWTFLWPQTALSYNDNICWGAPTQQPDRAVKYWWGAEASFFF